jgi:hypothetical protein
MNFPVFDNEKRAAATALIPTEGSIMTIPYHLPHSLYHFPRQWKRPRRFQRSLCKEKAKFPLLNPSISILPQNRNSPHRGMQAVSVKEKYEPNLFGFFSISRRNAHSGRFISAFVYI